MWLRPQLTCETWCHLKRNAGVLPKYTAWLIASELSGLQEVEGRCLGKTVETQTKNAIEHKILQMKQLRLGNATQPCKKCFSWGHCFERICRHVLSQSKQNASEYFWNLAMIGTLELHGRSAIAKWLWLQWTSCWHSFLHLHLAQERARQLEQQTQLHCSS